MATSLLQVRVNEETKKRAAEILEGLGMNLSEAVNIFLTQVVLQRGIPFEIKYPCDSDKRYGGFENPDPLDDEE